MFNFNTQGKQQQQAQKRKATAQVKAWVSEQLQAALGECDLSTVRIEVSEVQCGDPNCAPVDTIIRLWFPETQQSLGIPLEVEEVLKEDVEDFMPPVDVLRDWFIGKNRPWPEPTNVTDTSVQLRFQVGDRVQCCVGPGKWAPGTVQALWYRQPNFPPGMYAPYQIKLEESDLKIFAPYDTDQCIRAGQ